MEKGRGREVEGKEGRSEGGTGRGCEGEVGGKGLSEEED